MRDAHQNMTNISPLKIILNCKLLSKVPQIQTKPT